MANDGESKTVAVGVTVFSHDELLDASHLLKMDISGLITLCDKISSGSRISQVGGDNILSGNFSPTETV